MDFKSALVSWNDSEWKKKPYKKINHQSILWLQLLKSVHLPIHSNTQWGFCRYQNLHIIFCLFYLDLQWISHLENPVKHAGTSGTWSTFTAHLCDLDCLHLYAGSLDCCGCNLTWWIGCISFSYSSYTQYGICTWSSQHAFINTIEFVHRAVELTV